MNIIKKYTPTIVVVIAAIIITLGIAHFFGAFDNRQRIDTTWNFTRAQVLMPDGKVVSGAVESWLDFDDGDQLQVKIDGKTYLTFASNVVLIAD